jgi:hypothetical protein
MVVAGVAPYLPLHEENLVLATIEDQNGNGWDDVLVGVAELDKVVILDGHKLRPYREIVGPVGSRFGVSIVVAPDQDGDGRQDIVIGAPNAIGNGAVFVYRGGSYYPLLKTVTPTTQTGCVSPQSQFDEYGTKVAVGADYNGDGRADIIVGDPKWDPFPPQANNFGYIEIISVAGGGPPTLIAFAVGQIATEMGRSMVAIADRIVVNGSLTFMANLAKLDIFDPLTPAACALPRVGAARAPGVGLTTLGWAMTSIPSYPGGQRTSLVASSPNFSGGVSQLFRYADSTINSTSAPGVTDVMPNARFTDPWGQPQTFGAALSRLPGSGDFDGDGRTDFVVSNASLPGLSITVPSRVGIASFDTQLMLAEMKNQYLTTGFGSAIAAFANSAPNRLNVVVSDPSNGRVHLY